MEKDDEIKMRRKWYEIEKILSVSLYKTQLITS